MVATFALRTMPAQIVVLAQERQASSMITLTKRTRCMVVAPVIAVRGTGRQTLASAALLGLSFQVVNSIVD